MDSPIIYAADIGSVARHRFGWFRLPTLLGPVDHCDIGQLSACVAADLEQGHHEQLPVRHLSLQLDR